MIYLREVQSRILSIAKILKGTTERRQREFIVTNLKTILDWTRIQKPKQIQTTHFPKIRFVTEAIRVAENYCSATPFKIEEIAQLPRILKQELEVQEKEGLVPDHLQRRLEITVKDFCKSTRKTDKNAYEYLLCVNTLQIFGYNIRTFLFEYDLFLENFLAMIEILETHLTNFKKLQDIQDRQAYVFYLALMCLNDRENALQYTIDGIPGGLCKEADDACFRHRDDDNAIDLEELNTVSRERMEHSKIEIGWKTLWYDVKNQLNFLHLSEPMQPVTNHFINQSSDNSVQDMLRVLDMEKYYPQKLKYEDVLMISSSVKDDINKKPVSFPELPWYFIKHVIGLDSDTRENCHVIEDQDEGEDNKSNTESDNSDDDDDDEEIDMETVHPLDLVYIIYLCADDFLRQELSNKLARCQYAVPSILPSSQQHKQESNSILLHWGLKAISRVFYDSGRVVNSALVDLEAPLVTCISLGEETSWKSNLLNKMLSPQQETFWHQGLRGGDSKQRVSQGMAEVAWYLPGRQSDNKFPYPVTFVNVRGCSEHSEITCDQLYLSSTVACIFFEEIGDELTKALKKLKKESQLDRLVVVILHKKDNEKTMKKAASQVLMTGV